MNPEIVTAIVDVVICVNITLAIWMLLAHIAFCTPYVILSILPSLGFDPILLRRLIWGRLKRGINQG